MSYDFVNVCREELKLCGVHEGESNMLFVTGPNQELGGTNASPCHLDIPLHGYSLYLDDRQIIDHGQIVIPEMKPRR